MLRTKGEAGTGNVVEAVRHMRAVQSQVRRVAAMDEDELYSFAKEVRRADGEKRSWSALTQCLQERVPIDLVRQVAAEGKLPVVNFAAGGVATPADAALMMLLGADGVFVGRCVAGAGRGLGVARCDACGAAGSSRAATPSSAGARSCRP